jgi:hypothetical protein
MHLLGFNFSVCVDLEIFYKISQTQIKKVIQN